MFKDIRFFVKETFHTLRQHDLVLYAAAIAFFTVFSLPSFLIIIVQVIGPILGESPVRRQLALQLKSLIGTTSTYQIDAIIQGRALQSNDPLLNIIGIVFLLFSATVIFAYVRRALNSLWDVKPKPKSGILWFIGDRLLSLGFIVFLGFLMLCTLVLEALLQKFSDQLDETLPGYAIDIMNVLNFLVSLWLVSIIFALIFKYLPSTRLRWKEVMVGAVVTGVLFSIGRFIISKVLSETDIATIYGTAGSLAGILVWVFYAAILLLVGATFTKVYAMQSGKEISPDKNAVRIEIKEVPEET